MLDAASATRFDRRMKNGKTKPCLMACNRMDGAELEMVVKFSSGCERGVGGLVIEAIVAMFAADLGLPVPEPFLVQVDRDLLQLIPDHEIKELGARSSRIAFGSRLLPPSHSVWIHTRNIPQTLLQQAAEIFAFDALLMNGDRRPSNPNCLSDGTSFAIFDHELCFVAPLFGPKPWEPGGLEYLRAEAAHHLFSTGLRGSMVNLSRFAGAVEAITPDRIQEYVEALPPDWSAGEAATLAATAHLKGLRYNIEAAITEVMRVLS